jgi:tRNA threonylcarbamoyladenosine biosynthesis protein TsaB
MILLALSTSTPRGSAAILDGGRVLATAAYEDLRGHAERIFGAIDEVLAAAGVTRAAIDAIGCDVGPGSFTGVRVAVASAKGIALALGIPAAGVTSLEAMAAAAFSHAAAPGDLVVPALDAKKGELFVAAFDAPSAPPRLGPEHLAWDEVPRMIAALAPGALAGAGGLDADGPRPPPRLVVAGAIAEPIPVLRAYRARGPGLDLPDAAWIGRIGSDRLGAPGAAGEHDPALLEPRYVRAPDAKPAELGYTPLR